MKRLTLMGLTVAAMSAAGVGGYWAGVRGVLPESARGIFAAMAPSMAAETISGPVIYYRDPDGKPSYSATPRQTNDGRDFRAVHASEDVSFDDPPLKQESGPGLSSPRQVLYYRNPMGLPDTSPAPKKDSMGMDYIPVYDGEDDGPIVKVPLGKLQRTGVRSEQVERRPLGRSLRVPGMVQLDERRIAVVATRSDAYVEEVANVTTGDRVTKGQPLFRFYSPEIATAGAQFLTDLKGVGKDPLPGGARQRLENLGVPLEVIADIERTRMPLLSVTWRAPRDGIVLERNVTTGMKVSAGDVLFRLADVSTVWVLADVPEYDLGAIRLNARANVRIRSRPGETFAGRVSLLYPEVNESTRTAKIRIEMPNPGGMLLPNMYADVEIGTGSADAVVAVPNDAIIDTGTRQIVILDLGEGRFEPREVKVGRRGDGFSEIREGIDSGHRVVVAANFLIDAESNLRAALRAMTAPEAQP